MALVKDSTHDRIEGRAKKVRGKAKIAAGKIVRSPKLRTKGYVDVAEGKIQKKTGDVEKRRGR